MMRLWLGAFCLGSLTFLLVTGCGSGGNGNSAGGGTNIPPPNPSFTISLSPANVTLSQGGTSQTVVATIDGQNGFTGNVSLSTTAMPSGVTISPTSLPIAAGTSGNFTLSASSNAQIAQQSVTVNGTSGQLNATASLQLNVTGSPVPDPFHFVGGAPVHGFYDQARQLLFATNPALNELDVISGLDLSVKARVPVPQPWGIDQMADGNTLVIGTQAQEIVTVDEDTLAVTQHPYSAVGTYFYSLFFPTVVAMANGKVLMIGLEQGIDSNDIFDGGQYIFEWDSNTNTFSQLEPSSGNAGANETDSLARSADHKWAVFSYDQFYVYSSDSDSLTSAPVNVVNPPYNTYGIRGYAINSDGSEIGVASATQVTFLNRSLSVLGTAQIPGAFQTSRTSVQFSADGQNLYLQYDSPPAIEEINASTYSAAGYYSADMSSDQDNWQRLLGIDSSQGLAYIGIDGGIRLTSLTQTPIANTSDGNFSGPYCPYLGALPLNSAQQLPLQFPVADISVYIGGQPAPLVAGNNAILVPASATSGTADMECIDQYGNSTLTSQAISYGVVPIALSANLLPPTGAAADYLFGFGLTNSHANTPSLTLGGQTVTNVSQPANYGLGAIEVAAFQIPNGTPNTPAALTVSNSLGNATLTSAATYYTSSTVLPITGILQLIYDGSRNKLYALTATQVDVLDPATLQLQTPFALPTTGGAISYFSMALSPDGSKLVAAGIGGSNADQGPLELAVIDPDNASVTSTFTDNASSFEPASIAITQFNKVIICEYAAVEFDLTTSTFTALNQHLGNLIRTSPDGSHLYGIDVNVSNGEVYSIDPSTLTAKSEGFGYLFWNDLAVSLDGSKFAAVGAVAQSYGDGIGFFNSDLQYLNANAYPDLSPADDIPVFGAAFSPGGNTLIVPQGDSVEIWDATQGTLRARLMTPEELSVYTYPQATGAPMVALDSTGQTIFAVSASGLAVMTLPQPVDQITPAQWPMLRQSGSIDTVFYRSRSSRTAAMGGRLEQSNHRPWRGSISQSR
jgi:hypothetical protein